MGRPKWANTGEIRRFKDKVGLIPIELRQYQTYSTGTCPKREWVESPLQVHLGPWKTAGALMKAKRVSMSRAFKLNAIPVGIFVPGFLDAVRI